MDLVERVVIVDNSEKGTAPDVVPGARIIRLGGNMGVAHGWNLTIKATPKADWWAMVNSDVEVARSDCERLAEAMSSFDLVKLGGYEMFGISRRCVRKVGWFDENYHPAYAEDNDYQRRATLAKMRMKWMEGPYKHEGSLTIRLDPVLRERNNVTYVKNVEYHHAKWGGPPGTEAYEVPFNKPAGPVHARLDIDRLADQQWESAQE